MNKKAMSLDLLLFVGLIILVSWGIWHFVLEEDVKNYKEYKEFCEERPDFCYCAWFECEYKTSSWTSTKIINGKLINNSSGISKETKELCDLATKLEDKKMLFKIGCLKE